MPDRVYTFRHHCTLPPKPCSKCGRSMVGEHSWRLGDRRGADTYSHSMRSGLCAACGVRKRRRARKVYVPTPPELKVTPGRKVDRSETEEILDEYAMIRSSCGTIRQAAERMGIGYARLDKMLYRARQRGDDRGNPPQAQAIAAQDRGAAFGRSHPHRSPEREAA